MEIIDGQLVFHEQLGVGKVLRQDKGNETLTVAFLFFWPTVVIKREAVTPYVPTEAFKLVVHELARSGQKTNSPLESSDEVLHLRRLGPGDFN